MADELTEILKNRGIPTLEEFREQIRSLGFISTTIPELDNLICKDGGIPREKITELHGISRSGKSLLAKKICNQEGIKALYIDTEGAINSRDLDKFSFDVVQENILENIWGLVNDCLDAKLYDVIVVDSIAATTNAKEIAVDNSMNMNANMARASILTNWMHGIVGHLSGSNTALIFINHLKEKVDGFGRQFTTPGGQAIPFTANLRIRITGGSKSSKFEGGQKTTYYLEKNRFGEEKTSITLKVKYE